MKKKQKRFYSNDKRGQKWTEPEVGRPIDFADKYIEPRTQAGQAELDREREERRDTERLRIRYTENLPVLQELFYANLLSGRIEMGKEQERAAQLDIDLSGGKWAAALAYIGGSRDAPLSTLSVQKLLEEALTEDRMPVSEQRQAYGINVSCS